MCTHAGTHTPAHVGKAHVCTYMDVYKTHTPAHEGKAHVCTYTGVYTTHIPAHVGKAHTCVHTWMCVHTCAHTLFSACFTGFCEKPHQQPSANVEHAPRVARKKFR